MLTLTDQGTVVKTLLRVAGWLLATAVTITNLTTPATAAQPARCGTSGAWSNAITDHTRTVRVTLWWRWLDTDQGVVQVCARAEDRRRTPKPINLRVVLAGGADTRVVTGRGATVASVLATSAAGVEAVGVRGEVSPAWPGWTFVSWNRELDR